MKKLLLLIIVAAIGFVALKVNQPYAGFTEPVLIEFPRGTSSKTMATHFSEKGVVENPLWFTVARALRFGKTLQAGEYEFDKSATPLQIVDRLIKGDVHYYQVVIPEGSNIFDIARIAGQAGIGSEEGFLNLIREKEGFLFPAVYRYTKGTTAEQLVKQMESRFQRAWKEAGGTEGQNQKAIVTLASLIEKEAKIPSERTTIASVYQNRLDRNMKLDCDPTVIYAALLIGKYRGTIYRSDLDRESPYNTYRVVGLPPGPIANPGLESLKAALNPAKTDYIFFVAYGDGSGRHVFSKTMGEHNRAVEEYRRGLQAQKAASSAQ